MDIFRTCAVLVAALLLGSALAVAEAMAQDDPHELAMGLFKRKHDQLKQGSTPEDSKIGPRINMVLEEMATRGITRSNVGRMAPEELSNRLVRVSPEGDIQAYIYLTEVTPANTAALEELGVRVELSNSDLNIVQGWVPFDAFGELTALPFVTRVKTPGYGSPRTGSVNTEGDAIVNADDVRTMLGITGAGIRVGVISDGTTNAASAQATLDLPFTVVINPGSIGLGDEGTAMLEIIHDIAPGAALFFTGGFSGVPTTLEFIGGINWLVNTAIVDVIVDDIGYFTEPYFEDGDVATAAQGAVDAGVGFFSAAGNDAENHYQRTFTDTDPVSGLHDFGLAAGGGTNTTLLFTVAGLASASVVLEWNDLFGASGNDYDLLLSVPGGVTCSPVACVSFAFQDGNDDPIESVTVTNNNGGPVQIGVGILQFSGVAKILEMYFLGPSIVDTFPVPGDSVFGHPAADGVVAVGAARHSSPSVLESFSSRGPSTITFPAPVMREKPNVIAPDGVSVTGAGTFPSNFLGTSASAPHAAGVAALILEANPGLSPAQVKQIMEDTAVALSGVGGGGGSASARTLVYDPNEGFGMIDAFAAVEEAQMTTPDTGGGGTGGPPGSPTPTPSATPTPSPSPSPAPSPIVPVPSSTLPPPATPTGGPVLVPDPFLRAQDGGCSIAAIAPRAGTLAINVLLPMLPFGVLFALRRRSGGQ